MSNLKKQYNKIIFQKSETERRIKELKKNHYVEEYLKLCEQDISLSNKEKELYTKIETEKYTSCHHIWAIVDLQHDYYEGRSYSKYGCIKCGLDQRLLEKSNRLSMIFEPKEIFTLDEMIMLNCMHLDGGRAGKYTDIQCDLDLAKKLYSKIKKAFPNIDDETAIKYFEIELDNAKISESKGRAKVIRKS